MNAQVRSIESYHPTLLLERRPEFTTDMYETRLRRYCSSAYEEAELWLKGSPEAGEWEKYIDQLVGKQWTHRRPTYKSSPVNNLLLRSMEQTIAVQTDIRLAYQVTASDEVYAHAADILTKTAKAWWINQNVDLDLAMGLIYAYMSTGFLRYYWNPRLMGGYGDFQVAAEDIRAVLPIGPAVQRMQDWEGVIYTSYRPMSWFRQAHPTKWRLVQPDNKLSTYPVTTPPPGFMSRASWAATSAGMKRFLGGSSQTEWRNSVVPVAKYTQFWMRDHSFNESNNVVQVGPEGTNWGYKVKPGEPLYPRGRLIITGGEDFQILDDGPNIYWHGRWPFIALRAKPMPWQFHGCCYSSDTEVLTKRGWLKFADTKKDDWFATRSKTKQFEWQKAIRSTNENYTGPMYNFKSRSMDIFVTPNHRMLVGSLPRTLGGGHSKQSGRGRKIHEAIITAAELALFGNNHTTIPQTSVWVGTEITAPKSFATDKTWNKPVVMSPDDYCAFMGAYLAEGWTHKRDGVFIAQFEKSKGFLPYKKLLTKIMGHDVKYTGTDFNIPRWGLMRFLKPFGLQPDRYIPEDIMDASVRQLKIFWNYFVLGDGSLKKRVNPNNKKLREGEEESIKVHTTSKKMAGQLVEIAQKIGWSASNLTYPAVAVMLPSGKTQQHREKYEIVVRFSPYMGVKAERQEYAGTIHCVTVPNGTLYVRRNGKPAWCGNSELRTKIPLQAIVNNVLAAILDLAKKAVNPPLMYPDNAFSTNLMRNLDISAPGLKLGYNANSPQKPEWGQPPQLQQFVYLLLQYAETQLQDDSGLLDLPGLSRKKVSPAGDTLAQLKEGQQLIMRLRGRYIENDVHELGEQMTPNFIQFYTLARRITMFGMKGVAPEDVFDWNPGTMIPGTTSPQDFIRNFSFQVTPNSLLNSSRQDIAMLMMALRRQGDLDRKTLFEKLDLAGLIDQVEAGLAMEKEKSLREAVMSALIEASPALAGLFAVGQKLDIGQPAQPGAAPPNGGPPGGGGAGPGNPTGNPGGQGSPFPGGKGSKSASNLLGPER